MSVNESRRFRHELRQSQARLSGALVGLGQKLGVTGSGAILFGVAVVAWLLGWLVAGRPMYLLSYTVLVAFGLSFLIARRPLPLTGTRSDARPRLAEGETIDMEVLLTAKRRLSTFVLEEKVPALLGEHSQVAIASLAPGEEVQHSYSLTCYRRGRYQVGPLVARWGDPFGFTQRELVLAEPFEVLVHPSIEPVEDRPLTRMFEDPPIRPPISKPWPDGMEFYGMRAYAPGDDIRRIVWRAFARTGQLLVRESEQGITDKITLILDTNRRHHSAGMVSESFETAIRALASLGVKHLREGYAVTLEQNSKRLAAAVRGGTSQLQLLDQLACVELEDEPVTEAIMRLVSDPSRDNHIVLATPRLDAVAASRLKMLVNRGASVLVAALLWNEEDDETLGIASSLGCQIVEIRPDTALARAFRREVGAGRL